VVTLKSPRPASQARGRGFESRPPLSFLAQYSDAEPELLGAEQALAASDGPAHTQSTEALAAMYRGWERADPGKGHAAQADAWKARAAAR